MAILEEETYKKFGYYPSDLSLYSGKKILATCDDCGKIRETSKHSYRSLCLSCANQTEERKQKLSRVLTGRRLSKEHKRKLSEAHKGKKNPRFGKHLSKEVKEKISKANKGKQCSRETRKKLSDINKGKQCSAETKKKMSEARKGKNCYMFEKHLSEETKQKIREARKHQVFPRYHTKPERIFEKICKNNHLSFKYTGDSSFWIKNINPDFVECNGKKIAVEIFGDYWHSPLLRGTTPYSQTYEGRKKILKKYGWKLIVFWESDLKRVDAEAFVLNTLKKNGI